MARARNIKPGFFQNEDITELDFEYRLLFIGLWTLADKKGRLEDRPKKIKMALFPADNVDVASGLTELIRGKFVQRYEVDNIKYIQILTFGKHQHPHHQEKDSCIPEPPKSDSSPNLSREQPNLSREQPNLSRINPSDSLIPDSLNLDLDSGSPIPDSRFPIPDKTLVELKPDHALEIFQFWQTTFNHPRSAFDDKRKILIKRQLKNYSHEDLKQAILGCSKTPWNIGDNPDGRKYDSIELILRDSKHIDDFMRNADNPPGGKIKTIQNTIDESQAQATRVKQAMGIENEH